MASVSAQQQRNVRGMRRTRVALPLVAIVGLVAACAVSLVHHFVMPMAFLGGSRSAPSLRQRSASLALRPKRMVSRHALLDSEGRKIKEPEAFDASDASSVIAIHTAEFKKRPFGVLAYAPSPNGKGAMILEMRGQSRYPGDPQGQAFVNGLKEGYAVKAIDGKDVSTLDFWDIMDLLDDKLRDNSAGKFDNKMHGAQGFQPVELPLTVDFAELKRAGGAEFVPSGDFVDRSDPRYADLPSDAVIREYKIPKAPASYTSPVVQGMRSYVATLPEPAMYAGPRYRGAASINEAWIREILNGFKAGKLLPMKDAYQMAIDVFDILVTEKTLGRVNVPEGKKITVVGDLHGQLYDFDHMLSLAGMPSEDNTFVFNGDFVDRGPWSVEVMFTLLAFKLMKPRNVFMNRGNHESEMANTFYGFFGEVEAKYEKKMCELFAEVFRATPLCHVLNGEVFVVHGGIPGPDPRVWWKGMDNQISFDGRQIQISLEEIENLNRFMEPDPNENPLMIDLLWSDPKGKDGYGPSGRMSSGIYLFGPDVSRNFMEYNGLKLTMRSHEVKAQGYRYDHEGQFPLITVFSAPNYVDKAGNMASVAVMTNTGGTLSKPEFIQYSAQPHPDVPSGAYAVGGPLHPETAKR